MHLRVRSLAQISSIALLTALSPALALAETVEADLAAESSGEADEPHDIVVTGTLVRGVAPVGSQLRTIGVEDIERQGATTTNQILASIPQMAGFNGVPRTSTASQGVSGYRPNLRNLPPLQNGTTLVLLDSHNLVGGSVQQNFPDISALPTGAIERVEVVLDGGSATYGSDAVGGVLNFITRNRFDGIRLSATGGFAPGTGYRTYNAGILAGTDWSSGNLVVNFELRGNNPLYANEREFPRQDLTPYGGSDFRSRICSPGNIIIGAQTYALPDRTPGTLNLCDTSQGGSINGEERQYSGYISLSQSLSDNLDFQVKAFATHRRTTTPAVALSDSGAVIDVTNPFFQPIGAETRHTVAFSWAPVTGEYSRSYLRLKQYDISPSLTWRLRGSWQLKATLDYGRTDIDQEAPQINTVAAVAALRGAGLTTSTALNPYDLLATDPGVLRSITDYGTFNHTTQTNFSVRTIADGPLFELPGGAVRVAVGAQYQRVTKDDYAITGPAGTSVRAADTQRSRNIYAVFGELVVPVIGPDNAIPLVQALVFNASVRHNKYQSIGSTTDPKFGVNWTVFDGFKVRANWGTAFVAPGINDTTTGGIDSVIIINSTASNLRAGDPTSDRNRPTVTIQGGGPGLKPVTAKNWSVGFDFTPPDVPGLSVGATYWSVALKDLIQPGCPISQALQLADPSLEGICYYYKPTLEQALALTQGINIYTGAGNSITALYGAGNDPYILSDGRKRNFGGYNTAGLDFRVAYRHRTSWGSIHGAVSGTRYLKRESQSFPGAPFINTLATDFSKTALQGVFGFDLGRFTASATVNYQSGYTLTGVNGQTKLGSYSPVNLYFRYDLNERTSFTLNIDNVGDIDPPFVNRSGGIVGSTLGRYVALGIRQTL